MAVLLMKNNPQHAAIFQLNAFVEVALGAEGVERARDRAGILAQLGRLALEAVDLLDDLDGNQDIVALESQNGIGIV